MSRKLKLRVGPKSIYKKSDNHVLGDRAGATNADNLALAGRVIIEDLSWYVAHYTPSISNQKLNLEHLVSKASN